uniref:Cleavage and polyadenylation specificity factor subunit 2 n=1 Tax=Physcomitrium patens TaxID=3218 RepID=A0A7I4EGV0_PHYPA
MGTSVQVTPLSGAHSEAPLCYLLQVDGFRFLLDCGWTDSFDLSLLEPLKSVAPTIDAVLLSYPDTIHLGAFTYAFAKLGLQATMYCTLPVHHMGQMYMYDHVLSRKAVSNFDLFTLDDVDTSFANSVQLKYQQHYQLQGKGEGMTITPYAAGHLLGGTIWKITKDTEEIIYAVDFNHRKERHLNKTVLENFVRPAVLITDAYNALNNQPPRKQRDQEFIDMILKVLRAEGNVLLPVETAGRVLELILHLESNWAHQRLSYPVALLTNVSYSTVEFAKSLLEWMSDSIARSFGSSRENSFLLKYLKLCHDRKEFDELPSGPKVVFASMASLEGGFARDLFVEWATDSRNLVLFTERGQMGTLAKKLQAEPPPKIVKVTMSQKIPLTGEELQAYELEQRLKMATETEVDLVEEVGPNSPEAKAVTGPLPLTVAEPGGGVPLGVEGSLATNEIPSQRQILIDGFTASDKTAGPMFPLYENPSDWDEYGEVINPEDYRVEDTEMMDYQSSQQVYVKCALYYMDFEGRSDGRSIKNILAHVAPIKLVLVHGSAEATEHLRQHCVKNVCRDVYAPRIGETQDVTSDLCAYKVRLTERLMSSVLFRKLGDYEVAWIDGEIGSQESEGMLPLLPSETPPPHKSVFVGDLRLADFKQLLATKGIQAEFAGGVLRCGDAFAVRRSGGSQQLVIEGPLSEEYYKLRDLLYSQFYML